MGEYSISKNISTKRLSEDSSLSKMQNVENEMDEVLKRWNSCVEIEKQKKEWDAGTRNPLLMKKAKAIIDELAGRRFTLDTLAEKHFYVYVNYLVLMAKKRGYKLLDPMKYPWFVYQVNL